MAFTARMLAPEDFSREAFASLYLDCPGRRGSDDVVGNVRE